MATIPFRSKIVAIAPPYLSTGTGERLLYAQGLAEDAVMEMCVQGTKAHIPFVRSPYTRAVLWIPPPDALTQLGGDRGITRGLNESDLSYATRLQRAYESWQFAGTARGFLSQILGYILSFTPKVLAVSTQYDPSTYPPTPLSSSWDTYPVGRDPNSEPEHLQIPWPNDGEWDWDSLSPVTGSYGWWGGWIVIFAVAPQNFINPPQAWGAGSVYTGSGYYSTVTAGAYVLAGSYTGASQAWGAGSTYIPAADGYYSTVRGGAYVLSGTYGGTSQAWGTDATTDVGGTLAIIVGQFKAATTWIRGIVVSYASAEYDPTQPAGMGVNPDGTWGQWSKVDAGAYTDSRFTDSAYGAEVL